VLITDNELFLNGFISVVNVDIDWRIDICFMIENFIQILKLLKYSVNHNFISNNSIKNYT
jgi:hypothetical protein